MSEEITLKNDQQTCQKHQNGDFIDGVHSPYIEGIGSGWILFAEKITCYLTHLKEFLQLIARWLCTICLALVLHILSFPRFRVETRYHLP